MTDGSRSPTEYLRRYLEWLLDRVEGGRRGRLLDIGCHHGGFVRLAREAGYRALGLDTDEEALRAASVPGGVFTRGDAQALPFRTGTLDVVTMFDVLEHLPAPYIALRSIHRALRMDGMLAITTPNVNAFDRYLNPRSWSGVADPDHKYLFSMRGLDHLLNRAGFRVEERRTPFHALPPTLGAFVEPTGLGGQLWVVARARSTDRAPHRLSDRARARP